MDIDTELPSTPTPRRVDLSCLPAAVKTHIARLCAEQDNALRMAISLTSRTRSGASYGVAHLYGRFGTSASASLGNLFCVSKEWSAIAAPFRFEDLDVEGLRCPIFVMRIARLRGRHFRQVSLNGATVSDLIKISGLLPSLPNITSLMSFDFRPLLTRAQEQLEIDQHEAAFLMSSMKDSLARVEELTMRVGDATAFIDLCTSAVRARLVVLDIHLSSATGFSAFYNALLQMPNLIDLEFIYTGSFADLDRELSTLLAAATRHSGLPLLRRFRISSPDTASSVLDFMSLFAPTLELAALKLTSYDREYVTQGSTGATGLTGPFPDLQLLVLEGDVTALAGPLGSITDVNMPFLQTLVYMPNKALPQGARRVGEPPIPAPQRSLPLRELLLGPKSAASGAQPSQLVNLPARRLLTARDFYRGVLWYSKTSSRGNVDFVDVREATAGAIDFLRCRLIAAKFRRDVPSLVRIARALCQVELERIAYEA